MLQVQKGSQLHLQTRTGFLGPAVLPWTSSLTALGCLLPVLQVTVGTKAGDVLQVYGTQAAAITR